MDTSRVVFLRALWALVLAPTALVSNPGSCSPVLAAEPASSQPVRSAPPAGGLPTAPDMLLLYYDFDARGPRDWTAEQLRHYLAYHEKRGTTAEKPTDVFFDSVIWMYHRSSRGRYFLANTQAEPTTRFDWQECLDRCFVPDRQLHAMDQRLARVETELGRPVRAWVVLTIPYPDVRVTNFSESSDGPAWNFKIRDADRLAAVEWFVQSVLTRWRAARFKRLDLLGFYWFTEWHTNLRKAWEGEVNDLASQYDLDLIRSVARHLHAIEVNGRKLTLTWIPYNAYADKHRDTVLELLQAAPMERIDYLMVQPNYFFPHLNLRQTDLIATVRNIATIPCGVEVEFDESLLKEESARQRLREYLQVIRAEHPEWRKHPVGYYQGVRTIHEMARSPDLAPLYDELYRLVREHRETAPRH